MSEVKSTEVPFKPRPYQVPVLRSILLEGKKRALLVWSRRSGKDTTCFQIMWLKAMETPGLYLYLLPVISQAATVIWKGRSGSGLAFLDYIPKELVKKVNESTMSITLINGSILRITGSNNYEALIGSNPKMLVLSEFQSSDIRALELLRPIVVENGGIILFTATPRSKNHLYDLYMQNKDNPEWHVEVLTVDDIRLDDGSPVITDEMIDSERKAGMDEGLIQQEFYCKWDSVTRGNYYSEEMKLAHESGRVYKFPVDPLIPVDTAWDIGISDSTSICLVQRCPKTGDVKVIYHFEENGKDLAYYAFKLEKLRHQLAFKRFGFHYLPHDVRIREIGSGMTRIEQLQKCGIHPRIVGNHKVVERIQCVRATLPRVSFHEENTRVLVKALGEYKARWDDKHNVSLGPLHDNYSHAADSFGYYCIGALEHLDPDRLQVQKHYASFTP